MKIATLLDTPNIRQGAATAGTPARVLGIACGLQMSGLEVHLVLADRGFEGIAARWWPGMTIHLVHPKDYRTPSALANIISERIDPDLVIDCEAEHLVECGVHLASRFPVIFDMHDDDAKVAQTLGEPQEEIDRRRQAQRFAISLAGATLVSTPHERDYVGRMGAESRCLFVPNGCDDAAIDGPMAFAPDGTDLVLIGNRFYPPNMKAAEYAAGPLTSELTQADEEIGLRLVGQGPYPTVMAPGVQAMGLVDSLAQAMTGSVVGLAPVTLGSGAKMKVRDYCAAGLPVLSTTEGAAGLQSSDGVIVEDDLSSWPGIVLALMADRSAMTARANSSRELAHTSLRWSSIGSRLKADLQEINLEPPSVDIPPPPPVSTARWLKDNVQLLDRDGRRALPNQPLTLS